MINNSQDFENLFNNSFGDIDRTTLSKLNEKVRIELGGENGNDMLKQAINRSAKVLQYCFNNKAIWLRIVLWGEKEEKNLYHAGLEINKADEIFKCMDNDNQVLYLHYKRYSKILLLPVVKSIINFDMAVEPSANITCYFIGLKPKLVVNIYDDRGLDIYSPDKHLLNNIKEKFKDWLI